MNLSLSNNDPRSTVLFLPNGRAIYRIKTTYRLFRGRTTRIKRVDANRTKVGKIKWNTFSASKLWVGDRLIELHKGGIFTHSKTFLAQDGRIYKWKISGGYPQLVLEGHSITVAIFHKVKHRIFSRSQKASLEITSQGMTILDDIITTFVLFEHQRRKRKRSTAAATATT